MTLAAARFETFGGQHLVLLGLFVVGAVVSVLVGRAQRGADPTTFRRVFAVAVPCVAVPSQAFQSKSSGLGMLLLTLGSRNGPCSS